MRRGLTSCFVAEERETALIVGFYTLAAAEVPVPDLPSDLTRRLPRYPTVLVARIGRLAVDERFRGCQLGSALLASATARASSSGIAVFALVVDAKDEAASAFYRHHGFVAYASQPTRLIAPIQSLLPPR